jgi:hypothetical protein
VTPCVGSIHGIYVGAIPCSTLVTNHKAVLCRTTSNDEPVRSIYRLPSNGLEAGLNRSDRAAGPYEATISQPQDGSSRSCGASVLAVRRRPHPRAAGPPLRRRPGAACFSSDAMWPCECRAARAQSPPSSTINSAAYRLSSALIFPTSSAETPTAELARTFRQHRHQICRSRDRLPSRASCRIYILSGSRPPLSRPPRSLDHHVHREHGRYCPCHHARCAAPAPPAASATARRRADRACAN